MAGRSQDVLCYHNFKTGAKVLEHNMTKEVLLDIVKSNLTAEFINSTKEFARGESPVFYLLPFDRATAQREVDWDQRLKELMARRIQSMARLWFGRKSRSKFAWKMEQRRVNEKRLPGIRHSPLTLRSALKQTLVSCMARKLRGFKARCRFE
jgi:hypothetical protein